MSNNTRRRCNRYVRPIHRVATLEVLESRKLLAFGPELIAIQPNAGDLVRPGDVQTSSPSELRFIFDAGQRIDTTSLQGIRLTRAGFDGVFDGVSDVVVAPGYLDVDSLRPNEVVMRFAETLPDDLYRIEISAMDDPQRGLVALRNERGDLFRPDVPGANRVIVPFRLNLGPQVTAIVPQPITRQAEGDLVQRRDQIVVHFNNDPLDPQSAANPEFYSLTFVGDSVTVEDDVVFHPVTVDYNGATRTATLIFEQEIEDLPTGAGSYRLRIGSPSLPAPVTHLAFEEQAVGSSFDRAASLPPLDTQTLIISGAIDPEAFPFDFPGGTDEPGHRDIPVQSHLLAAADSQPGITTLPYNFQEIYGQDPQGNDLFNVITDQQRLRARQVLDLYAHYLGVQFFETADQGFTIVTGDIRVLDPEVRVGPGDVLGIAGEHPDSGQPIVIMDNAELWDDSYGRAADADRVSWFQTALHEIGHLLDLGHTDELPPLTAMNDDPALAFGSTAEAIFPGDHDIAHGRHLHRPEANDLDVYRFAVPAEGTLQAETFAERLPEASLLDSALTLYRQTDSRWEVVSRNDDYFSEDAKIQVDVTPGTYAIVVSSSGNTAFDPHAAASGFGGTSDGPYQLRLDFQSRQIETLTDATGVIFDGDADGQPGGTFDFWFRAVDEAATLVVDKSSAGGDGSLEAPLDSIVTAIRQADRLGPGVVIRVLGHGGADGDLSTSADNLAYEIGEAAVGQLADGAEFSVPQGTTVMVDAGAVVKLLNTSIHVGSSATVDRSGGGLQVLGTPHAAVTLSSYHDLSAGQGTAPATSAARPGDWGGLIFQHDVDRAESRFEYEQEAIFLNYVAHADIRYGGGNVDVDSVPQIVNPIHLIDARPTLIHNSIRFSADAAISATPNAFQESNFNDFFAGVAHEQSPGVSRIGPHIRGNVLSQNSVNGLFVSISTPAGDQLQKLTATGRWDDAEVVHVVAENLLIAGTPAGTSQNEDLLLSASTDAQLKIDAGVVVKLDGARIEAEFGTQLIAEGDSERPVVFTSLLDDRYGAGGTFDTSQSPGSIQQAAPGDWGGIYVGPTAAASLDHAVVAFGGGLTRVEGSFAGFNAIEVHQAQARITHSTIEHNASGLGGQAEPMRVGRGMNELGAIFIRGAQPILIDNVIFGTEGIATPAININVNSLNHELLADWGRSTGPVDAAQRTANNQGPLVRDNRLANNGINGMVVRSATLTTESVWDDADIVHVLLDRVVIPDYHTFGGLRLQSAASQSLVVKLAGPAAGFTATGRPLDIDDRVGGMLHVIGQPGSPVVLTSLADDSVGAGVDPTGQPQFDTDGTRRELPAQPPGSFQIDVNYGPQIRARPHIVEAFEQAVRIWEELLGDPITVSFDVELADLPDLILGQATSAVATIPFDTVRDALVADGKSHERLLAQLPRFESFNATLPQDPLNPFSVAPEIQMTRANARALGIPDEQLPAEPSEFELDKTRDALIQFNMEPVLLDGPGGEPISFDYDRSDGVQIGAVDFVGVAIHEIGHALGFISSLDRPPDAMDPGSDPMPTDPRVIRPAPLDLFRLEPGDAELFGFTDAPRVFDPQRTHVFFDGEFDPRDIEITGLRLGDVPLSAGSHWLFLPTDIGVMAPGSRASVENNVTEVDRRAFDLIGWDVVGGPIPGDWRGITLEQFSHDRNVAVVSEQESTDIAAPGTNAVPALAQFLGGLGRDQKGGDDELRLGFQVQGYLMSPSDVDVYSFEALPGTEVWFDMDRTTSSLDAVLELVDANGLTLVRSDDALRETDGIQRIPSAPGVIAHGLRRDVFAIDDQGTTNVHDPGFRVVLPGNSNKLTTYRIRVRSSSSSIDVLSVGQTSGAYQLQVRLQETNELPGSTIQYADIRYAVDGVRVRGLPRHSPLSGEIAESENPNDFPALPNNSKLRRGSSVPSPAAPYMDAQLLGNVLQTDRAAITVAGDLAPPVGREPDVDWYLFEVDYDSVQDPGDQVSLIFDLDYADGLSRANTSLAIYEVEFPRIPAGAVLRNPASFFPENDPHPEPQPGRLLYTSRTSSDVEDLSGPLAGDDVADLNRGSVGPLDPLLGPVSLVPGFYLLQVSTASRQPAEFSQFEDPLAPNPFVRAEPIDTLVRIVEDRIQNSEGESQADTTFLRPLPLQLGDVTLFVGASKGVFTADPFTGKPETTIGPIGNVPGDLVLRDNPIFDRESDDEEIQRRQSLYYFSIGDTDANSGNYVAVDPGTGNFTPKDDDGLVTFAPDPDNPGTLVPSDTGVRITAIAYQPPDVTANPPEDITVGYAVGQAVGARNVLFEFDAATGRVQGMGQPGAPIRPSGLGEIDTNVGGGPGGEVGGIAIVEGEGGPRMFAISDRGGLFEVLNYQRSPRAVYLPESMAFDGLRFTGLAAGPRELQQGRFQNVLFAITRSGELHAMNLDGQAESVFVDGQTSVSTGIPNTYGLDFGTVDQNLWHTTSRRADDPGHSGVSFHFGEPDPNDPESDIDGRLYDFAGGAQGSLITDPISLEGYSARDDPRLYFNYLLLTEQTFAETTTPARDTFRVYASDISNPQSPGQWQLLASSHDGDVDAHDAVLLFDNTFQDVPGLGRRRDERDFAPREEFDEKETVWRQANISLAEFAGSDQVRLRFDFSTAGSFDFGGAESTGGTELHAVAGNQIRDGQALVVDGTTLEFDLGFSLITPTGAETTDGEQLVVGNGTDPAITFELDRDGSTGEDVVAVAVSNRDTAAEVARRFAEAIARSSLTTVTPRRHGNRLHLDGAVEVNLSGTSLALDGSAGVADQAVAVKIHADSTPNAVAESLATALANTFAGGQREAIPRFENMVRMIGHDVADPGPLGITISLPGDENGAFSNLPVDLPVSDPSFNSTLISELLPAYRGLDNTLGVYDFAGQTDDFEVYFEGAYLDDIVVGFASRGQQWHDFRPPTEIFLQQQGATIVAPDGDSIDVGGYQLEIRRASEVAPQVAPVDPRHRFSQTVSLDVPHAADIRDGQTWQLADGTTSFTLEFDADGNSMPGHVVVPFTAGESSSAVAARLRDAVNDLPLRDVAAASASGDTAESMADSNRVNLFGNVVITDVESMSGFEFIFFDQFGSENRLRDQGQVIISNNSITHSAGFGVVVEDGFRDLPQYDFAGSQPHAQFNEADYVPHPGAARNLREINQQRLAPGISVRNNVIAFGNQGGIHFSGDPNGFVLIPPVAPVEELPSLQITDHHGLTETFFFVEGRNDNIVPPGQVPVFWEPSPGCGILYDVAECIARFSPTDRDMGDALTEAIRGSNLDVTVYRGRGDELFVEGASRISHYATPVAKGLVPLGRFANNTIVGRGGQLSTGLGEIRGDDVQDVGILVEDNARATLLNNIIVNFDEGVATDTSATNLVLGGTIFQGNVTDTTNVDVGDFAFLLDDQERLFVDRTAGNFYPSESSLAIDSSVDSLADLPELVLIKQPLGIDESPLLAPSLDLLGQKRSDDPGVEPPEGFGRNVFKDRGAIDRVDFVGPTARLATPVDNDTEGTDEDPRLDQVLTRQTDQRQFVIQLEDSGAAVTNTGLGIDPATVRSEVVSVLRHGEPLVVDRDYRFQFESTAGSIVLVPQAGVWAPGSYEIVLSNDASFTLSVPPPTDLVDGLTFEIVDSAGTTRTFEFESGYTLKLPDVLGAIADGTTLQVTDQQRTVRFEFDRNSRTSPGTQPVVIAAQDTAQRIAEELIRALVESDLAIAPIHVGGGRVHIGGTTDTRIDLENSALLLEGEPGLTDRTATAISFVPSADVSSQQLIASIEEAISDQVPAVTTRRHRRDTFLVFGVSDVQGLSAREIPAVADLAGNALITNQSQAPFDARFTIDLIVEDPPGTQADNYGVEAGTTLTVSAAEGVLANDEDPLGRQPIAELVRPPTNGTIALQQDGGFTYVPEDSFFGTDQFTYVAADGDRRSTETTVTIEVVAVQGPPEAVEDTVVLSEDDVATIDVLANDLSFGAALDPTSLMLTNLPIHGGVSMTDEGMVVYTPDPDYFGEDRFSYTVADVRGRRSSVTDVHLTVTSVNDAPLVEDDTARTLPNSSVTIDVLSNDSDKDGVLDVDSLVIVEQPSDGSAAVSPDGRVLYLPAEGFVGFDSFTYTIQDDQRAVSRAARVAVEVVESLAPWQNQDLIWDVSGDGIVVPRDALLVINELNDRGPRPLAPPTPLDEPPPFVDVSGDNSLSPIDALLVLNRLNEESAPGAAGSPPAVDVQLVAAALGIQPRKAVVAAAVDRVFGVSESSQGPKQPQLNFFD